MRDKLLSFIREKELIAPGETLVCAVSGGKDSVSLLHAMLSLQEELQITVEAAHVNHQLRGPESDRDEAFVRSLCESWHVPLFVCRADVRSRSKETGESVEEAARAVRYSFFESLGKKIATAHTMDDHLETVLLNLIRGTSLRGLCGIAPKRGDFVRPMLCVSREDVAAYLEQNGLPHVEDSTNAENFALRNRLRHDVIPLLRRENEALPATVFRMSEILRDEDAFLAEQAASLLASSRLPSGGWSCSRLMQAHPVIKARAARLLLDELHVKKPAQAHVSALLRMIEKSEGSESLSLPGVRLTRAYDALFKDETEPRTFEARPLKPGGSVFFPELGLRVSCRFVKNYQKSTQSPCTFALKCDTIGKSPSLVLRPRLPGDVISLPGGRRSLKKLFIDRKIPASERQLVPVLCGGAGVIAVYPLAVDRTRLASDGDDAIVLVFMKKK